MVKSLGTLAIMLLLGVILVTADAGAETVALLVSSQIRPYMSALKGFEEAMDRDLEVIYLNTNPAYARQKISTGDYALAAAVGPEAAQLLWSIERLSCPKMLFMVLDPDKLLMDPEVDGVGLRIPIKIQLEQIEAKLHPRSIGVLYHPRENQGLIEVAKALLTGSSTALVPIAVEERRGVAQAFLKARAAFDSLWFLPDSVVISEAMVSYLTKKALFSGIAVVGYNHFFIEAGAVMAVSVDYRGVGIKAAHVAGRILNGHRPGIMPPPFKVEWNDRAWDLIRQRRVSQSTEGGPTP